MSKSLALLALLCASIAHAGKPAPTTSCTNWNPDNGKMNFAIVGTGYTSQELGTSFEEDFNAVVTGIVSREPYKSRKSQLAFHKVYNTKSFRCTKQAYNVGTSVILCDGKAITAAINANCTPYNQIIVLVKGTGMTGGSSYPNGPAIVGVGNRDHKPQPELNLATGALAAHESGHARYNFVCPGYLEGNSCCPAGGIMGYMTGHGSGGVPHTYTLPHVRFINEYLAKLAGPFIDAEAPSVYVSFADGQTLSQSASVMVFGSASDNTNVVAVRLLIDGEEKMNEMWWERNVFANSQNGFRFYYNQSSVPAWVLSPGEHTIVVEAQDVNGNVGRSTPVTVNIVP